MGSLGASATWPRARAQEGGMDRMEHLISHSFQQFQHERAVPAWGERIAAIEAELERAASGAAASSAKPDNVAPLPRPSHRVSTTPPASRLFQRA